MDDKEQNERMPDPPVYSDPGLNIYRATTDEAFRRQRRAQWAREASEGTVHPADAVWRVRQRALEAADWPAIPCDLCGKPGAAPLRVFGSPQGIVAYIEDHVGIEVPGGRERLLAPGRLLGPGGLSIRVLIFCSEHAPPSDVDTVVEPGYETDFEKFAARFTPGDPPERRG